MVFTIDASSTGTGSISGSTLTVTGAGTIILDANQAGNANYNAAAQVQQTLVVNKASQTITFGPLSPVTFGVATDHSRRPPAAVRAIRWSSPSTPAAPAPASISGSTLTVTGAGIFVLDANQAGNANYNAAAQVQQTLVVNKASQTITFMAPTNPVTFGVAPITLGATGGASGNAVVFSIDASSTGTGTISGSTLTVTGAGNIVLDANQAGNANYAAAAQVQQTLVVNKASQTITFGPLSPVTYGVAPITLSATGGASGNPVTFSVVSGPGSISGNTLTVTGAGSIVVQADQAGNANYTAAAPVQQTVTVQQTLTVNPTPVATVAPTSQTLPPPDVSVAFTPSGQEVLVVVSSNGILTQFDASGAHTLAEDVRAASVAFNPVGARGAAGGLLRRHPLPVRCGRNAPVGERRPLGRCDLHPLRARKCWRWSTPMAR